MALKETCKDFFCGSRKYGRWRENGGRGSVPIMCEVMGKQRDLIIVKNLVVFIEKGGYEGESNF